MDAKEKPPQLNPLLKLALDLGPLVLFFIANGRFGIFGATGVFMVATVAALATGYVLTRHLPVMPLVTAIVVLIFGGLTLYLQDETFIKIKPTIIYVLFGAILLGGQIMGKPLLAMVFDQMFHLNPEGWRKLTIRWADIFLCIGRAQRDRLAHADHGYLGGVQGVRLHAAHVHLRRRAISAAAEIRGERIRLGRIDDVPA